MTENEAIEELKYDCNELGKAIPCDTSWGNSFENAYAMAIKALEEVQQYRKHGITVESALNNMCDLAAAEDLIEEYRAIGTVEELQKAEKEENILKFYYCDSEDSYLVGLRVGSFYYAHYRNGSWVFDMSRYLPWGKNVVDERSLWKEHTYPSEPREINFSEWLKGFVEKECGGTPEECRVAVEKQTETLTVDKAKTIAAKAICIGCGYLTDCRCDYNGSNCMVSKPMLESVLKSFDDWNRRTDHEKTN